MVNVVDNESMTPAEALRDIRGYASAGRVRFSRHAYERMSERGATQRDVIHACVHATKCTRTPKQDRWKVTGADLDGDALSVVVAIEDGLIVITLF
jgi:hypothetical protein